MCMAKQRRVKQPAKDNFIRQVHAESRAACLMFSSFDLVELGAVSSWALGTSQLQDDSRYTNNPKRSHVHLTSYFISISG